MGVRHYMTFLDELGNPGFQIDVFTHVAGQLQPFKKKKNIRRGKAFIVQTFKQSQLIIFKPRFEFFLLSGRSV